MQADEKQRGIAAMTTNTNWHKSIRGRTAAFIIAITLALWPIVVIAGVNDDFLEAAKRGDLPEVKRLIVDGADVNTKNNRGVTALMFASHGGYPEVVQELLAVGADVNAKNNYGSTALMVASTKGNREIVLQLLTKGARLFPRLRVGKEAPSGQLIAAVP